MPELWLTKRYPGTVFVDTNLPNHRLRSRKYDEISQINDDSTDIFKSNIFGTVMDQIQSL